MPFLRSEGNHVLARAHIQSMASDVDGQNRADVDPALGAPDPILISGELVGSAQLSIYLLTGPPKLRTTLEQIGLGVPNPSFFLRHSFKQIETAIWVCYFPGNSPFWPRCYGDSHVSGSKKKKTHIPIYPPPPPMLLGVGRWAGAGARGTPIPWCPF